MVYIVSTVKKPHLQKCWNRAVPSCDHPVVRGVFRGSAPKVNRKSVCSLSAARPEPAAISFGCLLRAELVSGAFVGMPNHVHGIVFIAG